MYKLNFFKYLLVLILELGCFATVQEKGYAQSQSPSLSSENINHEINQIRIWVFLSYLISLGAIGISIYQLLWTNNQNSKISRNEDTINQIDCELKSVKNEIHNFTNHQKNLVDREEFEKLKNELSTLSSQIKTLTDNNQRHSKQSQLSETELIEVYNNNSDSLSEDVIHVSETQESILQSQHNNTKQVILEKVPKGKANYWVLASKEEYYILPKPGTKIHEFNYQNITSIFILQNYKSEESNQFYLIKPGKLSLFRENTWELIEKGRLKMQ